MEDSSEVSYCDKESWDEWGQWGSHSSLSQHEEGVVLGRCDGATCAVRAERDGLARALAAERAHDARLAELHGVIAELVRRRDARPAIPEESDADCSPPASPDTSPADTDADTDASLTDNLATDKPSGAESPPPAPPALAPPPASDRPDTRSSRSPRPASDRLLPPSPGRCEPREAKLATRVRLRRCGERTADSEGEARCVAAAERLARTACDAGADDACAGVWRARAARLAADCRVLECALARALDTALRLSRAVAVQESSSVALCGALRAADRALETYDVLLALAETGGGGDGGGEGRAAAESVARRLLARLEAAPTWGEPLLSPGPWHELAAAGAGEGADGGAGWGEAEEARLRAHAARLKRDTVALRALRAPPELYAVEEDGGAAEMEAAVLMQELLQAREARALRAAALVGAESPSPHSPRRRRHWLDAAAETDL